MKVSEKPGVKERVLNYHLRTRNRVNFTLYSLYELYHRYYRNSCFNYTLHSYISANRTLRGLKADCPRAWHELYLRQWQSFHLSNCRCPKVSGSLREFLPLTDRMTIHRSQTFWNVPNASHRTWRVGSKSETVEPSSSYDSCRVQRVWV
jgi:hypothetical protein